jgi:hypothetical protein
MDAPIKAVDNHVDTISRQMPKNSVTVDTMEQLIEIYKMQPKKATCKARAQRVLREHVQAQRVEAEQLAVNNKQAHRTVLLHSLTLNLMSHHK